MEAAGRAQVGSLSPAWQATIREAGIETITAPIRFIPGGIGRSSKMIKGDWIPAEIAAWIASEEWAAPGWANRTKAELLAMFFPHHCPPPCAARCDGAPLSNPDDEISADTDAEGRRTITSTIAGSACHLGGTP
jgi:hypothetical protein